MNNEWLSYVWQHYNIVAALLALAGIVANNSARQKTGV